MTDVYTDGATVGINGRLGTVKEVGIGVAIPEKNIFHSEKKIGISNNEAEFKALIAGMKIALDNGITSARFNMDSQIVVNRANGSRPKKLKYQNKRMDDFQDEVLCLAKKFVKVEFVWIKREKNTLADELSKIACNK